MKTHLAYGKNGLNIDLDDAWDVQVIEPRFVPGLPDPLAALQAALRAPVGAAALAQQMRPSDRVGIIINDITRPTPNPLLLQALLGELEHIPRQQITLFIALGTHRPNTDSELRTMIGEWALEGYR